MIKKPVKKRNQTIGYWQRKADRLLQDICREMYQDKGCLICPGEYSCGHHFIPKSQSTILRYNIKNMIPICAKHHNVHHSYGDSTVHAQIQRIKGDEWIEELLAIKRKGVGMKCGYVWYREQFNKLNKILC